MGFTRDLLDGIAQLLDGAGGAVYRPAGAYADGETAIVVGGMPAAPDAVIALAPYALNDDPTQADSVQALQVRCRGASADPRTAFDLADAVFDRLHGHPSVDLAGGVRLLLAERKYGTPLGVDNNQRAEWSDTYHLTVHRPSQHRH